MKLLTIRMSAEMHKELKVRCAMEEREMVGVVKELIEGYLKEKREEEEREELVGEGRELEWRASQGKERSEGR